MPDEQEHPALAIVRAEYEKAQQEADAMRDYASAIRSLLTRIEAADHHEAPALDIPPCPVCGEEPHVHWHGNAPLFGCRNPDHPSDIANDRTMPHLLDAWREAVASYRAAEDRDA